MRAALLALALVACSSVPPPSEQEDSCDVTQALEGERDIVPAPDPAPVVSFAPMPDPIPVLLFHAICDEEPACATANTYGMTRTEFYRTILMLHAAGFTTVSTADYVHFLRLEASASLPSKPVLLTFDDGRLDSYRNADAILAATGARATMFVITARPESADPAFMFWSEIATAQASGRWDMQLHGHNSHVKVDDHPWMAWRFPGETFEDWKARAEADIWAGLALLRTKVPGFVQLIHAVPFGDYGQISTNDPAIPIHLRTFFAQRFAAWLVQPTSNPDFTLTTQPTKERYRYTIKNTSTAETVYAWLQTRTARRARTPSL